MFFIRDCTSLTGRGWITGPLLRNHPCQPHRSNAHFSVAADTRTRSPTPDLDDDVSQTLSVLAHQPGRPPLAPRSPKDTK
jgi:hypothetical protein